jgi:hypothetical protein
LGNEKLPLDLYVCDSINFEIIIGANFFADNNLSINFSTQKLEKVHNTQLFVYQDYTLLAAIAPLTNGQQAVFEPSDAWRAKECLLPRQLVTIDHSKPFILVEITNCSDLPVLLRSLDLLGDLFPLLSFQQPVGPLHETLPAHVDSIQTSDQSNSKSPNMHKLSLKEFSEYFDFSKSCLTSEQITVLLDLLYEYDELFVKTGETLRMTHMMEMDIKLKLMLLHSKLNHIELHRKCEKK